jgi:hypothetical protein
MAAALVAGLGLTIAAAQEPDGDLKPANTKGGWWVGEKPRYKGGRAEKKSKAPAEDKPALPNPAEVAAFEQERQMNAFSRRVEVCLRLRQIALDTGNDELQRQAEELEARAWEVYRKQTAHLPLPAEAPEDAANPVEKPSAGERMDGRNETREGRDKP